MLDREEEVGPGPTIWDTLSDLGRWAETLETQLPMDLAANHDHYLHGLPKRTRVVPTDARGVSEIMMIWSPFISITNLTPVPAMPSR